MLYQAFDTEFRHIKIAQPNELSALTMCIQQLQIDPFASHTLAWHCQHLQDDSQRWFLQAQAAKSAGNYALALTFWKRLQAQPRNHWQQAEYLIEYCELLVRCHATADALTVFTQLEHILRELHNWRNEPFVPKLKKLQALIAA